MYLHHESNYVEQCVWLKFVVSDHILTSIWANLSRHHLNLPPGVPTYNSSNLEKLLYNLADLLHRARCLQLVFLKLWKQNSISHGIATNSNNNNVYLCLFYRVLSSLLAIGIFKTVRDRGVKWRKSCTLQNVLLDQFF